MKGRPHGRCEIRIYKIRFDVLLCIVLSSLVILGEKVLCFMAFHIAGCKAGIFPSLIPGKKKRERT